MSIKNKIGIIGKGFVGSAVAHGFSAQTGYSAEIRIFDKDPIRSENSLEKTVNQSDFIFLSVPTPASNTGQIDLSIVEEALSDIDKINKSDSNIVLLRSTVTPGTSLMLQKKFSNLRIVFNPEFLTERSALFDFINQSRVILGGDSKYTKKVKDLYRHRFGDYLPVIETNYETAELIKYMNNLFFATKVSFLNEMKLVADKTNVDWDKAMEGFVMDGRVGHSHLSVPGPDGKLGFGGSCFPKDIQAMINFGKSMGLDMHTISGAWKTNLQVRPDKDWETLEGRAVVKKNK
jgi:UDPglucose 6-dehydrogenase